MLFKNSKRLLSISFTFIFAWTLSTGTVLAKTQTQLVSTIEVVNEVDAEQAKAEVSEIVNSKELKAEFQKYGLTAEEVDQRLASLSDKEILDLHKNAKQAQAGGLLLEVLLVILIIYFAKRL
tara:strand:+ start:31268 stop:31633 length:366 start_codon:yes stop_codon:yes gene_type:complete